MGNLNAILFSYGARFFRAILSWGLSLFILTCSQTLLPAQTLVGTITHDNFFPFAIEVYEPGNRLFVSDWGPVPSRLLVYDGQSLALLADLGPLGATPAGALGAPHVLNGLGKVYVNVSDGDTDRVAVVDADTLSLIRHVDLPGEGGVIGRDEVLRQVYVLIEDISHPSPELHVLDALTDQFIGMVPLRNALPNFSLNPVTHALAFGYLQADFIDVVDAATLGVTSFPAFKTWGVDFNWVENKVVGIGQALGAFSLDLVTGAVTPIACSNDALLMYFNPAGNRMYTSAEVNRTSTIIEGPSDSCFLLPMYGGTDRWGFYHAANHAYAGAVSNRPESGSRLEVAVVIDDASQLIEQIPLRQIGRDYLPMHDIAVHQGGGRVFIASSPAGGDGQIAVIQDDGRLTRPPLYWIDPGAREVHTVDPGSDTVVHSYWGNWP